MTPSVTICISSPSSPSCAIVSPSCVAPFLGDPRHPLEIRRAEVGEQRDPAEDQHALDRSRSVVGESVIVSPSLRGADELRASRTRSSSSSSAADQPTRIVVGSRRSVPTAPAAEPTELRRVRRLKRSRTRSRGAARAPSRRSIAGRERRAFGATMLAAHSADRAPRAVPGPGSRHEGAPPASGAVGVEAIERCDRLAPDPRRPARTTRTALDLGLRLDPAGRLDAGRRRCPDPAGRPARGHRRGPPIGAEGAPGREPNGRVRIAPMPRQRGRERLLRGRPAASRSSAAASTTAVGVVEQTAPRVRRPRRPAPPRAVPRSRAGPRRPRRRATRAVAPRLGRRQRTRADAAAATPAIDRRRSCRAARRARRRRDVERTHRREPNERIGIVQTPDELDRRARRAWRPAGQLEREAPRPDVVGPHRVRKDLADCASMSSGIGVHAVGLLEHLRPSRQQRPRGARPR